MLAKGGWGWSCHEGNQEDNEGWEEKKDMKINVSEMERENRQMISYPSREHATGKEDLPVA